MIAIPKHWPVQDRKAYKPIDWFIPYDKNPRTHPAEQIELLGNLIVTHGPDQPIVVDESRVILKGHGRLMSAMAKGLEVFTFVQHLGLSAAEKTAMRLADNQVSLLSGWNTALIQGEIGSLKTAGYDIALLGFPEAQLRGWGVPIGNEGVQDPEATPSPPKVPIVRTGDVWLLGEHRLVCGDSTKAENVIAALNGCKPHLMVTDPPYGVDYDPAWRADANKWKGSIVKIGGKAMGKVSNDDTADWTAAWNLFRGDVVYVWHGGLRSVEQAQGLQASGFIIRSQIIWNKMRLVISRGDYHWQHEACWYAVRKGKTGHWNSGRTESTVWDISKPQASETGHGTQKPIDCMKRPIENSSRKGDAVYEPFSGSGTTIIACEMTGRRCLAIELDPAYVQVAVERWQNFTGKEAVLEATGATFATTMAERQKNTAPRKRSAVKTPADAQAAR